MAPHWGRHVGDDGSSQAPACGDGDPSGPGSVEGTRGQGGCPGFGRPRRRLAHGGGGLQVEAPAAYAQPPHLPRVGEVGARGQGVSGEAGRPMWQEAEPSMAPVGAGGGAG
eukprot:3957855-Pyramimonas_sp.AAC.1